VTGFQTAIPLFLGFPAQGLNSGKSDLSLIWADSGTPIISLHKPTHWGTRLSKSGRTACAACKSAELRKFVPLETEELFQNQVALSLRELTKCCLTVLMTGAHPSAF
jgi:hypothetical protein